jgi:predicted DCC family thiol-disulfide oxidoreductase YuxK
MDNDAIVLFDGVCNLCTASVRFMIRRDPAERLRFATLQSATGRSLLERHHLPTDTLETFVVVAGDRCYTRSDAALEVVRRLRAPWPLLVVFKIIPRAIRDAIYSWVARHRYRWFGRTDQCMVPTGNLLERFLA